LEIDPPGRMEIVWNLVIKNWNLNCHYSQFTNKTFLASQDTRKKIKDKLKFVLSMSKGEQWRVKSKTTQ